MQVTGLSPGRSLFGFWNRIGSPSPSSKYFILEPCISTYLRSNGKSDEIVFVVIVTPFIQCAERYPMTEDQICLSTLQSDADKEEKII